jgi:uncharacterized protein YgiM (DUF1202 family)
MYRIGLSALILLVIATSCALLPDHNLNPENGNIDSPPAAIITVEPVVESPVQGPSAPPAPTAAPVEPTITPQTEPEVRVATGVVNVDSLNLRLGPGLDHVVVRLLHTGQELIILGRNEKLDWLLVELPSGTQGWVYSEYVNTPADIAELPLREAYGGAYIVEPAPVEDAAKPLDIRVVIENNLATVTISGFPGDSPVVANLRKQAGGAGMTVASGETSLKGNATLRFAMPAEWPDGTPVKSGSMVLVVSTTDGNFTLSATIQYYR